MSNPDTGGRRAALQRLTAATAIVLATATAALAGARLAGAQTPGAAQPGRPAAPAADLKGPLRIVVGYAPGGSSDRGARLLGEILQQRHGLTVVVDNKPAQAAGWRRSSSGRRSRATSPSSSATRPS